MKDEKGHGSEGKGSGDISHQSRVEAIGRTLGAFMRDTSGAGKVPPVAEHLLEHIQNDPELLLHMSHFAPH